MERWEDQDKRRQKYNCSGLLNFDDEMNIYTRTQQLPVSFRLLCTSQILPLLEFGFATSVLHLLVVTRLIIEGRLPAPRCQGHLFSNGAVGF